MWVGADGRREVTACAVTVDLMKRDSEIKILVGCSPDDVETIRAFYGSGPMRVALFVR